MNRKNLEIQSAISSEFEAAPLQFDLEPIDSSVLSDSQVVNQIVFCRKLLFEILTCWKSPKVETIANRKWKIERNLRCQWLRGENGAGVGHTSERS